jgi:hypothetical protein
MTKGSPADDGPKHNSFLEAIDEEAAAFSELGSEPVPVAQFCRALLRIRLSLVQELYETASSPYQGKESSNVRIQ